MKHVPGGAGPSSAIRAWGLRILGVACLIAILAVWKAWGTVQWGNHLLRIGAVDAALSVYRSNLTGGPQGQSAAYNLGTALLRAEAEGAERYLQLAAEGPDSAVVQKAHYNLGYRLMTATEGSDDVVSDQGLLIAAIRSSRMALRLDPDDQDARWNLALAQRMYEELPQISEEGPTDDMADEEEGAPDDDEGAGAGSGGGSGADAEGFPPADVRQGEGSQLGSRETPLGTGDPGPLSELAAREVVGSRADDPQALVQAVLWSQRPGAGDFVASIQRPE